MRSFLAVYKALTAFGFIGDINLCVYTNDEVVVETLDTGK
jgi:hypothetical protein